MSLFIFFRRSVLTLLLPLCVSAHGFAVGSLYIGHPWARATPPAATTAAVYLTIENKGSVADTLLGVSTSIAQKAEIHHAETVNGIAKMRAVPTIDIAPSATFTFAPGGYHIMLMGLQRPLKTGDAFSIWLNFKQAGKHEISVYVQALGG